MPATTCAEIEEEVLCLAKPSRVEPTVLGDHTDRIGFPSTIDGPV